MIDRSWQALLAPGRAADFFAARPLPPLDSGPGFSAATAWWLGELSRCVYRDPDDGGAAFAAVLRDAGLSVLGTVTRRSTHAVLFSLRAGDGAPVRAVVFRGTDDLRDWLHDLHAVPVRWGRGGNVHRGFRAALAPVWRELRRSLAATTDGGPLMCAGHSLGGALALLCASLVPVHVVYTFGGPRVGDAEFAATLAAVPVHRVVNGDDVVPRLPPAGRPLGFVHTGQEHRLLAGGGLASTAGPEGAAAETPSAAPFRDDRRWFEPAPFLSDHAPVNYTTRLWSLATKVPPGA